MNRRAWLIAGSTLSLSASRLAQAALPKVGYLIVGRNDAVGLYPSLFVAGLRDAGLVDGVNIEIVWRFAEGSAERLPALAEDLVAQKVRVIVAPNLNAVVVAAKVTKTIPIVMSDGIDPVGLGLARSLRRPGGNVTGTVWDQDPELTSKYLELVGEAVPGVTRLGCLIDTGWPGIQRYREVFDRAALTRRVALNTLDVRAPEDIDRAVPALAAGGAQAVFVYGSALTYLQRQRIIDLMVRHALPDIWLFPEAVQAGALMSYGANLQTLHRRAGYFVDRILRGADPAEIPIEMPTRYELWVNLKRAKRMGMTLAPSLLSRADQVIE